MLLMRESVEPRICQNTKSSDSHLLVRPFGRFEALMMMMMMMMMMAKICELFETSAVERSSGNHGVE